MHERNAKRPFPGAFSHPIEILLPRNCGHFGSNKFRQLLYWFGHLTLTNRIHL